MHFKFKIQPYQTAAAKAVADVFAGQPNSGAAVYLRDLGRGATKNGMETIAGFEEQLEASEGYANAPLALGSATLLDNIHKVQRANGIPETETLAKGPAPVNLDVEMETGTGKTYVYTKTMLELNRLYGWTKFIVVVPSIAIREGVYKSLKNTEQHFFEQYGKAIRYFVYDSSRLGEIDRFSSSADVNVMIINMQAFNTSMKEGGRSKEARIMYSERDEFGSRRPIDVIAANNPIVIQDEPQKMGGKATQAASSASTRSPASTTPPPTRTSTIRSMSSTPSTPTTSAWSSASRSRASRSRTCAAPTATSTCKTSRSPRTARPRP